MGEYVFTFVVIMTFGIPALAIWTRHRREMARMEMRSNSEMAGQYAATNRELEERVRVLERIVTDKHVLGSGDAGHGLATEIEALRDERPVEERLAQGIEIL